MNSSPSPSTSAEARAPPSKTPPEPAALVSPSAPAAESPLSSTGSSSSSCPLSSTGSSTSSCPLSFTGSSSSSYPLAIRAPLTSDSSDDEGTPPTETDNEGNLSVGSIKIRIPDFKLSKDDMEGFSCGPLAGDLEMSTGKAESSDVSRSYELGLARFGDSAVGYFPLKMMPIARLSGEDEDGIGDVGSVGDVGDVDGDGFSDVVVRVPPVTDTLKTGESGDSSAVENLRICVLGSEETDPSGDSDAVRTSGLGQILAIDKDVSEAEEVANEPGGDAESSGNAVLCREEEDPSTGIGTIKPSAAAEWHQGGTGMEKNNFFCQIPVATEEVGAVIEDIFEFEMQEHEMIESDDDIVCKKDEESDNRCADNENSAIGWDSITETEQSCNEMQEGKPVVEKDKISGEGSSKVNYLKVIKKDLHEKLEFNSAVLSSNSEVELNEQVPALAVNETKSKSGNDKHADSGCNQMRESLFEERDQHQFVETSTCLTDDSKRKDSFSLTARDNRVVGLCKMQEIEGDGGNDYAPEADDGLVSDEYASLAGSASLKLMAREMDQSPLSSHSGFDGEIVSDPDEMETDEADTGFGLDGVTATPIFNAAAIGESEAKRNEDEMMFLDKVQTMKLKYLHIAQRLGNSPQLGMTAPIFHNLGLSERIRLGRLVSQQFGLMSTDISTAMPMKTAEREDLDFSCNILVIGKTGVGKSATINSIFGEKKSPTSAFEPMTTSVKEICGTVDGVKLRVIDTPGLKSSTMEQNSNKKILLSVNKLIKKFPLDVVLYVDRLDIPTSNCNDLPILDLISSTLGSSIWRNSIIVLTHAASEPPEEPGGISVSYNHYIAQRSHIVQQSIRQVCGDSCLMTCPLNPVALVENHPSCGRNGDGQAILPNGQRWRSQLLLLCYSLKISLEAKSLLKPQDPPTRKLFGLYIPPLLSFLMQVRSHPQFSTDLGGTDGEWDVDLAEQLDSTQGGVEYDDDYDQLPPFEPLRKSQISQLTKELRKAYLEEYDYKVKLFRKKQWTNFQKLKELKKRTEEGQGDCRYANLEVTGRGNKGPSDRSIPLPDMVLPLSFDGDNLSYRYRFLEITPQLLTRPILRMNRWDHDCGYDGISLEETLVTANRFPTSTKLQITKDKRELDSAVSTKHGHNASTLVRFHVRRVENKLAYILTGETKFDIIKKNRATAHISVAFLGDNVATAIKAEDQTSICQHADLLCSSGIIRGRALSLVNWQNNLAFGADVQSQFALGRISKMAIHVGFNNKLSGQISVRMRSSEQLQIGLIGVIPFAISVFRTLWAL